MQNEELKCGNINEINIPISALYHVSYEKKMERGCVFLKLVRFTTGKCFQSTEARRVITAPVKQRISLKDKLVKSQFNSSLKTSQEGNKNVCIVSCANSSLNYYLGQSYGKFDKVQLASQSWDHRRTNGDQFIINSYGPNPSLSVDSNITFESLNVEEPLIEALSLLGCNKPTLIQKMALKPVLHGENCLIAAETGSGKTLSYLVPILQQLSNFKKQFQTQLPRNTPQALVITPGRELCEQISSVCQQLTANLPVKCHHIIGGRLKQKMLNDDPKEMDILIGSFGAVSKLTTNKIYDLSQVKHIILDEADTLLDDSFNEKLLHFLRKFPLQTSLSALTGTQLIMASATMPRSAEDILSEVIPFESFNKITTQNLHRLMPHVPQKFIRLSHLDKPAKLLELVKKDVARQLPLIVFSNQTARCDWISMFLNENGISCVNLNGSMNHGLRGSRFEDFKNGKYLVLSCTDVVSRGLDTTQTHHVINYDVPTNISDYIHRVGRVGRVGTHLASGLVTTLVCHSSEAELVQKIEFAARKTHGEDLPNVNANIKRLINNRVLNRQQQDNPTTSDMS